MDNKINQIMNKNILVSYNERLYVFDLKGVNLTRSMTMIYQPDLLFILMSLLKFFGLLT